MVIMKYKYHEKLMSGPSFRQRLLHSIYPGINMRVTGPFLVIVAIIAGIGVFIVTRLVAGSLQERFNNQLLDSARAASNSIGDIEREQLGVIDVHEIDGLLESPEGPCLLQPVEGPRDTGPGARRDGDRLQVAAEPGAQALGLLRHRVRPLERRRGSRQQIEDPHLTQRSSRQTRGIRKSR